MLRQPLEVAVPGTLVTSALAFPEAMIGAARRGAVIVARRWIDAIAVRRFDRLEAKLPFKRSSFDRLIAADALDLTLATDDEREFARVRRPRVGKGGAL